MFTIVAEKYLLLVGDGSGKACASISDQDAVGIEGKTHHAFILQRPGVLWSQYPDEGEGIVG